MNTRFAADWRPHIEHEFSKEYFRTLAEFVRSEYLQGVVYPAPKNIFAAFDSCPYDEVKVVIIGQDPYHGKGQANGLAFSVNQGTQVPPSVRNIFKEVQTNYPTQSEAAVDAAFNAANENGTAVSGDLTRWAKQGVLLLNSVLTVRAASPASHQGKGWERFTDEVIKMLSKNKEGLVFILWGAYAQKKGEVIDREKHLVLEGAHPSPFSAHRGFLGSGHFLKANKYLSKNGEEMVDWQ